MITNVNELTRHKSALAIQLKVFNEWRPHIPCAMRRDPKNVMWIKMKFDLNLIVLYIYDNLKKAYE